jgi:para-nitrobenzyl esterase
MRASAGRPDRRQALIGAALIGAGTTWPGLTWAGDFPVAATRAGPVRGYADGGVVVFKGVRYGADTQARRFQRPAAPTAWTEVRDAHAYGPASPQTKAEEPVSEDCLFLNLWTPGLDDARRPVMVYIHGGEYSHGSGSSPLYDGARLARRGEVVAVALNHRLSAFGHLYLAKLFGSDYAHSGNAGLWDLVLALTWVRDNIARFGGDPGRVMLFGQSGGGAKIASLMAMPAAHGLFHRVATMSGQQVTLSGPIGATARARAFLDAAGVRPGDLEGLKAAPLETLIGAIEARDPDIAGTPLYFGPVLDQQGFVRHPFYPDASPVSAGIPMIIGNTHDETRYFLGHDARLFTLGWDELAGRLGPELRVDIDPSYVVERYRQIYPAYTPTEVFFAATTAARSWRGAVIEAELRAVQGSPAHVYQLDWRAPIEGGKWRAAHTLDIPLVFGTIDAPGALSGPGSQARAMSDQMSGAFLAFAHGRPPRPPGGPAWPVYRLDRRSTLVFDLPCRVADDPRGPERRLFAAVPYIQRGTY